MEIKTEYKDEFVGFKSANGRKLGELDLLALRDLAIIALESNDQLLINLFNSLPSIVELKKARVQWHLNQESQ